MSEWDKMIRASSCLGFADAEASQAATVACEMEPSSEVGAADAGRIEEGKSFSLQTVGALFGLDGEEPMKTLTLALGYKRSPIK
jgi:hypothetical protein